MKRIRILDYILLLHLFELREEKMDWWARLTFIASIILFGTSLLFALTLFNAASFNPVSRLASAAGQVEHLGLLAAISYFVSSLLSFLVASLEDSDVRARLLWLATVVLLLGSTILLAALLAIYTTSPLISR